MHLAELALEFAAAHLKPGGNFLVKTFQGGDSRLSAGRWRQGFDKVVVRKPKSSRDRSSEVYLLGLGCRPQSQEG
jgi:23S rRNA (uridine2552-2'-O)-methyltransferase